MSFFDWYYGDGTSKAIDAFLKGNLGSQLQTIYVPNRDEFLQVKGVAENIGSGNFVTHVLSLSTGALIEYNTYNKKFSYLRASMYYFATYSFAGALVMNDLVTFSGNRLAAGIETLESEYQKNPSGSKK